MNQIEGSYNQQDLIRLRNGLADVYSIDELEELSFDLGLSFDDVKGTTLKAKARELVQFIERRGLLSELVAYVAKDRPQYDWPTLRARDNSLEAARLVVEVGNALDFVCDV